MRSKISKLLLAIAVIGSFALTGCNDIKVNLGQLNREKMTSEETKTVEIGDSKKLYVENVTGDIIINKTDSGSVKIRTEKRVEGSSKSDIEDVMNNIATGAEIKGGTLEIKAVTKDGKEDFWKWKSRNHSGMNVIIDFYVDLPKDLEGYEVKNVTGNIDVTNLKGTVNVENVTGNITVKGAALTDSRLKLVTGNINCEADIEKASKLDIDNVTGNIQVNLPASAKFSIDAKVVTGSLSGNFKGFSPTKKLTGASVSQKLNGGGTEVKVNLVTGNIDLNEK